MIRKIGHRLWSLVLVLYRHFINPDRSRVQFYLRILSKRHLKCFVIKISPIFSITVWNMKYTCKFTFVLAFFCIIHPYLSLFFIFLAKYSHIYIIDALLSAFWNAWIMSKCPVYKTSNKILADWPNPKIEISFLQIFFFFWFHINIPCITQQNFFDVDMYISHRMA